MRSALQRLVKLKGLQCDQQRPSTKCYGKDRGTVHSSLKSTETPKSCMSAQLPKRVKSCLSKEMHGKEKNVERLGYQRGSSRFEDLSWLLIPDTPYFGSELPTLIFGDPRPQASWLYFFVRSTYKENEVANSAVPAPLKRRIFGKKTVLTNFFNVLRKYVSERT